VNHSSCNFVDCLAKCSQFAITAKPGSAWKRHRKDSNLMTTWDESRLASCPCWKIGVTAPSIRQPAQRSARRSPLKEAFSAPAWVNTSTPGIFFTHYVNTEHVQAVQFYFSLRLRTRQKCFKGEVTKAVKRSTGDFDIESTFTANQGLFIANADHSWLSFATQRWFPEAEALWSRTKDLFD